MKIGKDWPRIAGLHVEDQGDIALIWLANEKEADRVHLYDCVVFRRVELAVIAEGIERRGERIPISWEKDAEEIVQKLKDRRLWFLEEGYRETKTLAEVNAREIEAMMETDRFKVSQNNAELWLTEARSFYREGEQVPQTGFPLMSATRHAFHSLKQAVVPKAKRPKLDLVTLGGSVV